MSITSYVAASKQVALQHSLETTAKNIASQNVSGFQSSDLVFNEFVKNNVSYVNDAGMTRDLKAGPIVQTDNPLHIAITGPGYFAVQTKNGAVEYTRGGTFGLNADRYVVTAQGDFLLDQGQTPIQLPDTAQEIIIGEDGTLSDQETQISKVGVFNFENHQDMRHSTSGYLSTTQAPQNLEFPTVIQGAYEGSNVNHILATTKLTSTLREFQQNMKFIEEDNKLESDINQRLVKLAPTS